MTEYWKKEIDRVSERFTDSFGSLNKSQLNWKQDKSIWSIAQNIAHLIRLNNSYFRNFDEIKKGEHSIPGINALNSFAAKSLQALQPYTSIDRIERANTWHIWQPLLEEFSLEILPDFVNHQLDFKKHLDDLQVFFIRETFIKYPGETELIFKLEDCIDFLIAHENRHWIQAEEVKRAFDL